MGLFQMQRALRALGALTPTYTYERSGRVALDPEVLELRRVLVAPGLLKGRAVRLHGVVDPQGHGNSHEVAADLHVEPPSEGQKDHAYSKREQ